MVTYGNVNYLLSVSREGITDPVYIGGVKRTRKITRPAKAIPIPVSSGKWNATNPLNKIVDLKRDTEVWTFEGFLISQDATNDATAQEAQFVSIVQKGGTITVTYRGSTIIGVVLDAQIEDDANRSDLHVGATGYERPEKLPISFTILRGGNI